MVVAVVVMEALVGAAERRSWLIGTTAVGAARVTRAAPRVWALGVVGKRMEDGDAGDDDSGVTTEEEEGKKPRLRGPADERDVASVRDAETEAGEAADELESGVVVADRGRDGGGTGGGGG